MTDAEKKQIANMRLQGSSYQEIAAALSMTIGKVKSYCVRNQLGGVRATVGRKHTGAVCEQCGTAFVLQPGRKHKRFCSDACRMTWWAAHRDMVKKKTLHHFVCAACGKEFSAYGVRTRKFCSRACYGVSRHGKKVQP